MNWLNRLFRQNNEPKKSKRLTVILRNGERIEGDGTFGMDPTGLSDIYWFHWDTGQATRLHEADILILDVMNAGESEELE